MSNKIAKWKISNKELRKEAFDYIEKLKREDDVISVKFDDDMQNVIIEMREDGEKN